MFNWTPISSTGWWFQIFFMLYNPHLEKIPILTNIFQTGWNHQLVKASFFFVGFLGWHIWSFCSSLVPRFPGATTSDATQIVIEKKHKGKGWAFLKGRLRMIWKPWKIFLDGYILKTVIDKSFVIVIRSLLCEISFVFFFWGGNVNQQLKFPHFNEAFKALNTRWSRNMYTKFWSSCEMFSTQKARFNDRTCTNGYAEINVYVPKKSLVLS